jgi:hypothetical protein
MSGCGADILANELNDTLLDGVDVTLPTVNLSDPVYQLPPVGNLDDEITKLTNEDLTTGEVGGTGTFDVLMKSIKAHLKEEYQANKITGEQYSKAYTTLVESVMGQSVQYLLGRDSAYWQAVTAQKQALAAQAAAVTARVQLEIAKVQLQALKFEALNNQSTYALTKLKLSTESIGYCIAKYNLDFMLPMQLKGTQEQMEAARAQTLDTRSDGITPITGTVGKQKELYAQQIISYKRDSETKVAKLFTDAWITMKTIDEGVLPPDGFTNLSLDSILTALKANNDLD